MLTKNNLDENYFLGLEHACNDVYWVCNCLPLKHIHMPIHTYKTTVVYQLLFYTDTTDLNIVL